MIKGYYISNAHGLYEKYGFKRNAEKFMHKIIIL